MKKLQLFTLLLFFSLAALAQPPVDCIPDDYDDFDEDEQVQSMDKCVHEGANYIVKTGLSTLDKDEVEDYLEVAKMVTFWVGATPDHDFMITEDLVKVFKKNNLLYFIYFSCAAKAALDGDDDVDESAIKMFANYIANPKNNIEQKGKVKKFMKDFRAGNWGKYIGRA
ncbi:hypothetical protein GYB22_13355 [bacterium]|nr:hypothetical protein [bacterium]